MKVIIKALSVVTLSLGVLSACGGGGSGSDEGQLTVRLTDAPVDEANQVVVQFEGVELRKSGQAPIVISFDEPRQIDLLALRDGLTETLLDNVTLPAGRYQQIRLLVNAGRDASDSFIELDTGAVHPLYIPSGNQAGLRLVSGFTVPAGGSADFTIDFDLRKSVTNPPGLDGPYILKPALRIVDNAQVGAIAGTVAADLVTAEGCSPAVYVFAGADVTPNDEGSATAPLTSALVTLDDATGDYTYRAAFLTSGPYTAAFTCEAQADDPETDDDIGFSAPVTAEVTSGQTTQADFGL